MIIYKRKDRFLARQRGHKVCAFIGALSREEAKDALDFIIFDYWYRHESTNRKF